MLFSKANKTNNPVHCASRPRAQIVSLIISGLMQMCLNAQTPGDLIAQADQFGDRSEWQKAGPLYAKAEAEYHRTGDARNEMYAKLGRLHRDLENGSYSSLRAEVVNALAMPVAQTDPALRIRGLALLGNIDLNTNTAAAAEDWNEVLAIASRTGDQKWENRAKGELALVAGVNGDLGKAGLALFGAIAKA